MSNNINNRKNSDRILRPLGFNEMYFEMVCKNGSWVGTSGFIIDCKIDLYKNIERLMLAVEQWTFYQPFLRSKILNADEYDKNGAIINFKRYFKLVEDSLKLDNVTYLSFNSNNPINDHDCNRVCDFMLNYETNKYLSQDSGLLWRLVFIRFNTINSIRYGIYLTINHAISEGRNVGMLFIQLLNIIEWFYKNPNSNKTFKSERFTQSLETYLYNNSEAEIDKINIDEDKMKLYKYVSKTPDSFKQHECETAGTLLSTLPGTFRTNENQKTDYFDISVKFDALLTKLIFDDNVLKRVLKECAFYETKPIGFFSTLISLALYRTYKEYSLEHLVDTGIVYSTTVSLKQHLNIALNDFDMGYFITSPVQQFELPYIDINDSIFKKEFWKRANFESNKIHSVIKSEDIKEYPKLRKKWFANYQSNIESRLNENNTFNRHFTLTYLGNVESAATIFSTENFNFYKLLMSTSHGNHMSYLFFVSCLTNIDKLEFHFSYNRKRTSDKIIDSLRKHVTIVLENAIESNNKSKL